MNRTKHKQIVDVGPSRERERAMIRNADAWPRHPFLPMKKKVDRTESNPMGLDLGLLSVDQSFLEDGSVILFRCTLYGLKEGESETFATIDAMLDEGWQVD